MKIGESSFMITFGYRLLRICNVSGVTRINPNASLHRLYDANAACGSLAGRDLFIGGLLRAYRPVILVYHDAAIGSNFDFVAGADGDSGFFHGFDSSRIMDRTTARFLVDNPQYSFRSSWEPNIAS